MAGSNYYYPTILLSVMLLRYFSSEFSHIILVFYVKRKLRVVAFSI